MADNLQVDEGTAGKYAATDEISTDVHVPKVKIIDGTTDGTVGAIVDAGGSLQVDVVGALPAGTNSIGKLTDDQKVDLNKIAGASVAVSGGTEATALRVTLANDSTGVVSVDDNAGSLTVDQGTAANLNMTEASAAAIKTAVELVDDAVYVDDADWTDSSSKHLLVGGLYQSTPQTITDGDVGPLEVDANGKLLIGNPSIAGTAGTPNAGVLSVQGIASMTALQMGLAVANCIQWSHYANSYNSAQTSTNLVAADGTKKIYVGCIRISTGYVASATTTTVKVYLGTGAWSATEQTVFAGEFATIPMTGVVAYPGVVIGNGAAPFIVSAASDALKITTSGSTHCVVYVSVDYVQV